MNFIPLIRKTRMEQTLLEHLNVCRGMDIEERCEGVEAGDSIKRGGIS